jgi:Raf kinase inhibitor-like YbhB/YbcL family protein
MTFELNSPAFDDGHVLPSRYAHGGDNLSPPLHWSGAPQGTRSFALVVEDPDAPKGTFRHWAIYDLPPDKQDLPEAAGRVGQPGARQGVNDFGEARYDGPQPPRGHGPHHYHFRLMALDVDRLQTPHSAKVTDVMEAARSHVLAEAEMVGIYENP